MFPISNTSVSAAYILATVHFLYPKLGSFSDMEYYFYQLAYRDSKVPKRFLGLIQMQCSPSFDCSWGKKKRPHCMLAPATHTISGFTAREMSQLPTRLHGRGHWNPKLRWGARQVVISHNETTLFTVVCKVLGVKWF